MNSRFMFHRETESLYEFKPISMSSTKFLLAIKKLQSLLIYIYIYIYKTIQMTLDTNINTNGKKCEKQHRTRYRYKLNMLFVNR